MKKTKSNSLIRGHQMLRVRRSERSASSPNLLRRSSTVLLPEGANDRDLSLSLSLSHSCLRVYCQPPVYVRLPYKLINVINRPGSIAWESVLCRGTVSTLNDGRGGRAGEGWRSALFFSPLRYCSFCSSAYSVLASAECVEGAREKKSAIIRR